MNSQNAWIRLGLLLSWSSWALGQNYVISTIAGGGMPPAPAPALSASFNSPGSVAVDTSGNLYFIAGNGIFRVDSVGTLTRLAGRSNVTGYSGDGGPATNALLAAPAGVALDSAGNLYIADTYNNVIRKVSAIGAITTFAGSGSYGESGDGGPATSAQLSRPQAVAVDAGGNVYIADAAVIRKVPPSGIITTVAGNGTPGYAGDGGPATSAQIGPCYGLALDNAGNLYISDYSSSVVRKVAPGGTISTVAGNGVSGYSGDGGLATSAQLRSPSGLAVDAVGSLYIADSANSRIRKVTSGGTITTVAGNGTFPGSGPGFVGAAGDGSPATSAQVGYPTGVAVDSAGNLYIGDPGSHRVRKVTAGGTMLSAAGNGFTGYSGDGGPAASAQMGTSGGVAVDSAGNLYISDSDNNVVRKMTPAGVIATVAGNGMGAPGYSGDGGPATSALLSGPAGLALDASGNLYIADLNNSVVRKVTTGGTITTVAGKSGCGYSGDNGPAVSAQLCSPWGIAVDATGNLYIADSGNNRIRKVTVGGIITTVAGNGTAGFGGDGGPAISALLFGPTGVAVDAGGNVYIADNVNGRIRAVATNGTITTVAGGGTFSPGDGGPATSAQLANPAAVAVDHAGNLYIAETNSYLIRKVTAGTITSIAGNSALPSALYSGDGGLGASASIGSPQAVALDSAGNVYFADVVHDVIRILTPGGSNAVLTAVKSHLGSFALGQTGAAYTVVVMNALNAGPTTGIVTMTEITPAGLTLTSMSGTGWSCAGAVCSRSDLLNPSFSYPPITVVVNVATNPPSQVVNQVSVAGGGSPPTSAGDVTFLGLSGCTYAINPASASTLAAGASNTVSVTAAAGCPWSPSSNATWLTITAGASGSGSGTLSYAVALNSTGNSRSSTLTIGGQTFTVNQAGTLVTIDSPTATSTVKGIIAVSGWAIVATGDSPFASVPVTVDGVLAGNATYGISRPDVCSVYPGRPGCPNVGYSFSLNTAGLTPGPHVITVMATNGNVAHTGYASVTVNIGIQPPTVWIDGPSNASTVSGTITVSGWAIDNNAMVGTAIGSVKVNVDAAAPVTAAYGVSRPDVCGAFPGRPGCPNVGYSLAINTQTLSAGQHTITVTAVDSDGFTDVGSATVTVRVKNVAPTVWIDTPAANATVSGTVTVSGWAIDNASIVGTAIGSVQVRVDGVAVGNATYGISRPDVCGAFPGRPGCPNVGYTFALNTAGWSAGSHLITVSATDSDGTGEAGLASVTVTTAVSGTAPTVVIDQPAAGATVSGSVTISGWALDNAAAVGTAIGSVQVLVDGLVVGNATYGISRPDVCNAYPGRRGCPNVGYTFTWNGGSSTPGSHMITVKAVDSDGTPNAGMASATVTVNTTPATVVIDQPVAGAVSGTVTIAGWAIDNTSAVGTAISGVQVLLDGAVVGSATYGISRPDVCGAFPGRPGCPNVGYTFTLNTGNVSPGQHVITVTALDSDQVPEPGAASVTVTVNNGPPLVWIDQPVAGATVSGVVTVSGWAVDNGTIVGTAIGGVQVKVDGALIGTAAYGSSRADVCAAYVGRPGCPNVGYSLPWDTSVLSAGAHILTVTATDGNGNADIGNASVVVIK